MESEGRQVVDTLEKRPQGRTTWVWGLIDDGLDHVLCQGVKIPMRKHFFQVLTCCVEIDRDLGDYYISAVE